MLHLIKLSVGTADIAGLAAWQAGHARLAPPLRHLTQQTPRRADELCAGGSIYWVIAGRVQARQALVAVRGDQRQDGTPCCALLLDPELVPVVPRPQQPFQGWRYLRAEAAPPDLGTRNDAAGADAMPAALRLALCEYGLL